MAIVNMGGLVSQYRTPPDDSKVLVKIEEAVEFTMNGGDPIDAIGVWMESNRVSMERMDKVLNDNYDYPHGLLAYCERCKNPEE